MKKPPLHRGIKITCPEEPGTTLTFAWRGADRDEARRNVLDMLRQRIPEMTFRLHDDEVSQYGPLLLNGTQA